MAYRLTVHETTGQTPFRVTFWAGPTSNEFRCPQNFQSAIQDKLVHSSQLFEYVRSKCALEHRTQKLIFDKRNLRSILLRTRPRVGALTSRDNRSIDNT